MKCTEDTFTLNFLEGLNFASNEDSIGSIMTFSTFNGKIEISHLDFGRSRFTAMGQLINSNRESLSVLSLRNIPSDEEIWEIGPIHLKNIEKLIIYSNDITIFNFTIGKKLKCFEGISKAMLPKMNSKSGEIALYRKEDCKIDWEESSFKKCKLSSQQRENNLEIS